MTLVERAHVRHEPPDLIVGNAAAPRRHSVGTSFIDRLIDVAGRSTEMPTAVLEARPHGTGTGGAMAVHAVVRDEQFAALGDLRGIALEGIGESCPSSDPGDARLDVIRMLDEVG